MTKWTLPKLAAFYEEEYLRAQQLTNEKLLDDTLSLAGGDDYDGCYTAAGVITYGTLHTELYRRLRNAGFLLPADTEDEPLDLSYYVGYPDCYR